MRGFSDVSKSKHSTWPIMTPLCQTGAMAVLRLWVTGVALAGPGAEDEEAASLPFGATALLCYLTTFIYCLCALLLPHC